MDKEHLKEKIRLLTEWLRGMFALFVLIGSALTTLLIQRTFLNDTYYNKMLNFGLTVEIIIFIMILIINNRINQFINKLKQ